MAEYPPHPHPTPHTNQRERDGRGRRHRDRELSCIGRVPPAPTPPTNQRERETGEGEGIETESCHAMAEYPSHPHPPLIRERETGEGEGTETESCHAMAEYPPHPHPPLIRERETGEGEGTETESCLMSHVFPIGIAGRKRTAGKRSPLPSPYEAASSPVPKMQRRARTGLEGKHNHSLESAIPLPDPPTATAGPSLSKNLKPQDFQMNSSEGDAKHRLIQEHVHAAEAGEFLQ